MVPLSKLQKVLVPLFLILSLTDTDGDGIQDGTELGYTLRNIGPDTDTKIFQPDLDPETTTDPLNNHTDGDGLLDDEEDTNQNGRVDESESDPAIGGFANLAADFGADGVFVYDGSSWSRIRVADAQRLVPF